MDVVHFSGSVQRPDTGIIYTLNESSTYFTNHNINKHDQSLYLPHSCIHVFSLICLLDSLQTDGHTSFKEFLRSDDIKKKFVLLLADLVALLTKASEALLRITTALEHATNILYERKFIVDAKSVAEVFRYLRQFWSHTECELLSFVVEASRCDAATAKLQEFLSFREENAERIIIHPSQPSPPRPGAQTTHPCEQTPPPKAQTPPPSEQALPPSAQTPPHSAQATPPRVQTPPRFSQAPPPRAQTPPTSPHEASASDCPAVVEQPRAAVIVASVDTDVLTQKDYNTISGLVCSVLSIPKHVLDFLGTEDGSVRLKWRVHAALVGRIKSLRISDSHLQLLARHGVTRITVGHSYELCISTLHYWQRRAVYSVVSQGG